MQARRAIKTTGSALATSIVSVLVSLAAVSVSAKLGTSLAHLLQLNPANVLQLSLCVLNWAVME